MSPLDVLTRIEPNRIMLEILFISTGKTSDRSKVVTIKALCSCLHVWRQFRQTSTNTNSFKTWGLKGTLNKIQRGYYSSNNRQDFTLMYPGLNSLGSNLGQAFESRERTKRVDYVIPLQTIVCFSLFLGKLAAKL